MWGRIRISTDQIASSRRYWGVWEIRTVQSGLRIKTCKASSGGRSERMSLYSDNCYVLVYGIIRMKFLELLADTLNCPDIHKTTFIVNLEEGAPNNWCSCPDHFGSHCQPCQRIIRRLSLYLYLLGCSNKLASFCQWLLHYLCTKTDWHVEQEERQFWKKTAKKAICNLRLVQGRTKHPKCVEGNSSENLVGSVG